MCSKAVNGVNSNFFSVWLSSLLYLFNKNREKLGVVWSEFFLHVENQRNGAFQQFILGLELSLFEYLNDFICYIF